MRAILYLALAAVLVAAVAATPQDINSNLPGEKALQHPRAEVAEKLEKADDEADDLKDTVESTNGKLEALEKRAQQMEDDLDTMWLVLGAALVFLLTTGLGLIEAANTRRCSLPNVLAKNILVCGVVAVMWWAWGYGVAYSAKKDHEETDNPFIGNGMVFMSNDGVVEPRVFASWAFSYAAAVLATTIATSALGDRGTLMAYAGIAFVFGGGIYPVVVHWVWAENGWLAIRNREENFGVNGMIDWAGSGVIAVTGATVALVTTFLAGPRVCRFDGNFNYRNPGRFQSGNKVYQGLGVLFLWVGWYGLTCVSTSLSQGRSVISVKVAANTTLAAAGGALLAFLFDFLQGEPTNDMVHLQSHPEAFDEKVLRTDIRVTLNGVVAGLVAVSAGVSTYEPWAAALVGAVGGVLAFYGPRFVAWVQLDDPVETVSLFGFCGFWGLTAVGWFSRRPLINAAFGMNGDSKKGYGIWYGSDAEQWAVQMFGGAAIMLWCVLIGGVFVGALKLLGKLRVSAKEEASGINFPHDGASVCPIEAKKQKSC